MTIERFHPKQMYYGFPVFLVATIDENSGEQDITPLTSSFILKDTMVIGLLKGSKCHENIVNGSDVTINIPSSSLWYNIENIRNFSAKKENQGKIYSKNKIELSGLTELRALHVKLPRLLECPIQIEAKIKQIIDSDFFAMVELDCIEYFASSAILDAELQINPDKWHPLILKFNEICSTTKPFCFSQWICKKIANLDVNLRN